MKCRTPRLVAEAISRREALEMLKCITALPGHRFWRHEVALTEAAVLDSIALVRHCQPPMPIFWP